MESNEIYLAHEDCNSPTTLSISGAPGESGVSVLRLRFPGGAYYGATLRQHLVRFQMSPKVRLDSALTWQAVGHDATVGSFAIYPAGIECAAEIKESVDALIVAIDPDRLTLGTAENSALGARLTERLSGYDEALFDLARTLALEGVADYPNGRHYWNDVASSFIDGLVARHTSASATAPRGMLSKAALERLTDMPISMNQSRWLNLRRQWGAAHFTSVAFSADLSACLRTGTSCIFDYNAQSSLFAMDGSGSLKSRRVRALPTKVTYLVGFGACMAFPSRKSLVH